MALHLSFQQPPLFIWIELAVSIGQEAGSVQGRTDTGRFMVLIVSQTNHVSQSRLQVPSLGFPVHCLGTTYFSELV